MQDRGRFLVDGVRGDGSGPPQMEEQPVALEMYIFSPKAE